MTARQTTAGTASDAYKVTTPPIPTPRSSSEDPREPGRRKQ